MILVHLKKTNENLIRMTYLKHCPIEYLSGGMALHFTYLVEKKCSKKKRHAEISMLTLTRLFVWFFGINSKNLTTGESITFAKNNYNHHPTPPHPPPPKK